MGREETVHDWMSCVLIPLPSSPFSLYLDVFMSVFVFSTVLSPESLVFIDMVDHLSFLFCYRRFVFLTLLPPLQISAWSCNALELSLRVRFAGVYAISSGCVAQKGGEACGWQGWRRTGKGERCGKGVMEDWRCFVLVAPLTGF